MTSTKLAASYERKSNSDPAGIDAQFVINAKCAEGDGFLIPNAPEFRYSDDDTVGRSKSREAFDRLMAVVKSGAAPFTLIYIKDETRLGRWLDPRRMMHLAVLCEGYGVQFRFANGSPPIDFEHGDRREITTRFLMSAVKSLQASDEIDQLSRRITGGMRARVRNGFFPGAMAAYGLERTLATLLTRQSMGVVPRKGTIRHPDCAYRLVRATDGSAEVVAEMFRFADEGKSASTIANELNARKVQCPGARRGRGGLWTRNGVEHILNNSIYTGQVVWGATSRGDVGPAISIHDAELERTRVPVIAEGLLEAPIITGELWDRVRLKRQGTRASNAGRRKQGERFLLSGLLVCAKCGAGLTATNAAGGRARRYYRHERRTAKLKACAIIRAYVPVGEVEALVDQAVTSWLSDDALPHLVDLELTRLMGSVDEDAHRQQLTSLRAEEEDLLRAQADAGMRLVKAKSATERELFEQMVERLNQELDQCRMGLRHATEQQVMASRAKDRFAARRKSWLRPAKVYAEATIIERRGFLQELLHEVAVDTDAGTIKLVVQTP